MPYCSSVVRHGAPAPVAPAAPAEATAPAAEGEAPAPEAAAPAAPAAPEAPSFDSLEEAKAYLLTQARDKVVKTTESARFHGRLGETLPQGEIPILLPVPDSRPATS